MSRRAVATIDDMLFVSKVHTTAEQLNVSIEFVRTAEAAFQSIEKNIPDLVLIDLHSTRCDWNELANRLKADQRFRSIPIVGFFSHVQIELQRQAKAAGLDHVLPRSAFSKRLPQILQGEL